MSSRVLGVVVAVVVALGWLLLRRTATPQAEQKALERQPVNADAEQKLSALEQEVRGLRTRVAAQERRLQLAKEQRAELDVSAAALPAPEPRRSPAPSDEEAHARRTFVYQGRFESEPREAKAADEYEDALEAYLSDPLLGRLQSVQCRASMCRFEVRHTEPGQRVQLGARFGRGPLTQGGYDYLSEDETSTIAFVGMPGHALIMPDVSEDPRLSAE
jgi:hypothetical protein